MNKGNAEIWAYRARSLQASGDARAQREARSVLAGAISQIEGRKRAADEQLRLAQLQQREMQTGLVDGDGASPGAQPNAASVRAQALQAVVLQIDAQQRVVEHLEHTLVLLQRSLNDLLNQPGHADGANGRGDFWALVSDLPARIWNFELFSVTDTTMVSGRRVTVDYGVTVGKSLGILALFVLGCWLARKLTVVLVRQLTLRFGLSEQLARVIRRWIMSLLVVFVLVAVLRMARVPLAAFAFLGGALAIGIGFGTQNVIKNLISGVIILFERKVRVGDVVTVGGMSGEVTAVDLRATTVRGFDGIESIIPNSTLLEQQVSNWSSGVPRLRRVVRLRGVRGPQTSALRDLMLACASAHPSVLQQPPPLVLLEDLQADAAEWALYYWMRQDDSRSGMQVDSDLRMAMDSALQRSGIALARTRAIVQYSAQR
ncbi:MAG: mechanosensitive ion channel family protein [Giesbergeria sp.]